jgi:topoisomerase-4 subunit A
VIEDNKPLFIGVSDMLKISNRTVGLLKSELEIQLSELEAMAFLVFGRIFMKIKSIVTLRKRQLEDVIQAVDDGLKPH